MTYNQLYGMIQDHLANWSCKGAKLPCQRIDKRSNKLYYGSSICCESKD